ncbi:hypothetical protein OHU45_37115 [Streptomyces tubercidicus]|uniref:hypothetical protein n=1 Tax=Streptomyces tubercidicus TaxID=47759 RepID=UPI002E1197C7|nr:hypothetical protein OG761_37095 [Streptomyces tubercidicus]WSX18396.1 hypothetical protein OG690_00270 [Streptomyces tubercidicus]
MEWQSEEFGASHEGMAGAVLADGSEPRPVYLDAGSGSYMHETTQWWAYNGRLSRPRADYMRGACSCGWRGARHYPIDWDQLNVRRIYEVDTPGPYEDWQSHIDEVELRTVPLPVELADLLERLDDQLTVLADQGPLAALKAVAALERTTSRIGREAACAAEADDTSWEAIGQALGLTEKDARSRLTHYYLRR